MRDAGREDVDEGRSTRSEAGRNCVPPGVARAYPLSSPRLSRRSANHAFTKMRITNT